ncbi:L,D-transpeptidase [Bradyrhizobium sp. SSBR45G]|uniref:L,D-transpeptidase n=1 Tax=unclassified Bradyrhizobium TaxID=2631580 RepID=UPI002342AE19|nr:MULTISPECIES: L,D-transpeptidase [unclassified Bradyrhizobium]GLH78220.1 L,D-transpeptidase [Bradyrhizobium sp. SSBR45G]GLH86013.1 L,D-transpeptidase [Bradyrhizobium sp. SSBR45R]
MMIRQILTVCAVAAAGVAATSFAEAQQVYQTAPGAYSPQATPYPADPRGQGPDFDALDDEDAPGNSAALPPPGPVMSPDDPRYGRPTGAPVYGAGPVMSPDDPRYGRPAGPPAVIYADRPDARQQPYGTTYGNAAPGGDAGAPRPPGVVGGASSVPGTAQAPAGDRPMTVAALPPEEQPDAAPAPLPANLRRQEVDFVTKEPAGTIVVDTPNTYLYLVLGNGRAMRYGVRVGREGFTWTGVQKITKKTEWPDWYPPSEMIERQPYLPRFMAGGPGNPLGARAMYLGSTVYRIHGTNQPSTIGKFVSSGCIGMLNDDVSDLFDRVKVGTRVVVMPGGAPPGSAKNMAAAAGSAPPSQAPVQAQATVPGGQPTTMQPLPPPVTIR